MSEIVSNALAQGIALGPLIVVQQILYINENG